MSALEQQQLAALKQVLDSKFKGQHDAHIQRFTHICELLAEFPELTPGDSSTAGKRALSAPGTIDYFATLAIKYLDGREAVPRFSIGNTTPDDALRVILETAESLTRVPAQKTLELHAYAMAGENAVGTLLERYVAHVLEAADSAWIWCPGQVIRGFDFIRPLNQHPQGYRWHLLQVKNRSNTESSAHGQVRKALSSGKLEASKWFRVVASSGKKKWDEFPVDGLQDRLNEALFLADVRNWVLRATACGK